MYEGSNFAISSPTLVIDYLFGFKELLFFSTLAPLAPRIWGGRDVHSPIYLEPQGLDLRTHVPPSVHPLPGWSCTGGDCEDKQGWETEETAQQFPHFVCPQAGDPGTRGPFPSGPALRRGQEEAPPLPGSQLRPNSSPKGATSA